MGQSLTIPRMKTEKRIGMVQLLGYDPVEKLHKVLGMVAPRKGKTMDHQVLTLGGGSEKATWRMSECAIPCSLWLSRDIFINGVFYYTVFPSLREEGRDDMIICFDVRSEKYNFVKFSKTIMYPKLLDCHGKLALTRNITPTASCESIVLWVLQDPETHEWSRCVYIFPPMWKDVVDPDKRLEIAGVTGPNEFVMSPTSLSDPFHVYYCNFEKETVTRVVIQGMGALGNGRSYRVRSSLNHVEDVKLMEL